MNENEQPVESANAPEQEPVPVKIEEVAEIFKTISGDKCAVRIVLAELPRITFEWAVIAVRNILLALLFWSAIIAVVGFALFLVFGMIAGAAGIR
jgi:hypothetical protein